MRVEAAAIVAMAFLGGGCGGGGGSAGSGASTGCGTACGTAEALSAAEVERIVAQAAFETQSQGAAAHIVVVDRVGNVLAVYRMGGAPATVSTGAGFGASAGLEGVASGTIPAVDAALAKAITGAYLSSNGNAFSTRTASQIIQEHFNPGEEHQPAGPLYGVQFSQLTCSDVMRQAAAHGTAGPKRSPLGLAADPGGLPLYKNGVLVGGIGIEADGRYGLDRDIDDVEDNLEEHIAVAGASGFAAPVDIRGDRITADGRTFRYLDSEATRSDPSHAPALAALPGALAALPGYADTAVIRAGTLFGTASSGLRLDDGAFAAAGGWVLVDVANAPRFAPRDGSDGLLRAAEVRSLLAEALAIAGRARAQIRRPLGAAAELSIAVTDTNGDILGFVRTPDAPLFGIDVAVQKARTAMFFSHPEAGASLAAAPDARYLSGQAKPLAPYAGAFTAFVGNTAALSGGIAWSVRAIGSLHRPFYPDGIEGTSPGPLSTPFAAWSPFNVGFQLDVAYNQLVKGVLGDLSEGCAGRDAAGATSGPPATALARRLRNGAQIFPGGMPLYRGNQLVGAIGVSGDGVDQDDMVAFLGIANAAHALATGLGNAPAAIRADTLAPQGVRLRYAQCPQSPFNDSADQNACAGL